MPAPVRRVLVRLLKKPSLLVSSALEKILVPEVNGQSGGPNASSKRERRNVEVIGFANLSPGPTRNKVRKNICPRA